MVDRLLGGQKLSWRCRMVRAIGGLVLAGVVAPVTFGYSASAQSPGAGCERFDVLLLMDTSLSLRTTDPSDLRIDAAKTFIDGLAQSGSTVNMTIAGFGYVVAGPQNFSLPEQQDAAAASVERFRDDNGDRNTDYVNALRAAVKHFEGNPLPQKCKIFTWFTDGAHDIELPTPDYIGEYTTVFGDGPRLEQDFERVVCGPMPDEGYLFDKPLSEQIREFEMVVRMIDLQGTPKTARQRELRDTTGRVLGRLLKEAPDDDCGVIGKRIPILNAGELVGTFFSEAQRQVRSQIDCAFLADGVPAALVESVAVLASTGATATVLIGSRPRGEPGLTTQYQLVSEERLRSQDLTVVVEGGALESCFVTLGAVTETAQETPTIFDAAPSTPVYFAVGPPGVGKTPLAGVDDRWATLEASVDNAAVPIKWSQDEQQWLVNIPPPDSGRSEVTVVVDGFVTVGSLREPIEQVSLDVEVSKVPPVPQIRWDGDSSLQGTGQIDGVLVASALEGAPGDFCVTFDAESRRLLDVQGGTPIGMLRLESTEYCFPAGEGKQIPAPVTVDAEGNTEGELESLGYEAVYTPPGETEQLNAGSGDVQFRAFELTKPADAGKRNLIVGLLTALSALISYAVFQAFTIWQSRLGDPRNYLVADLPAVMDGSSTTPALRLSDDTSIRIQDLHQVSGSRTEFALTSGVRLKRRLSLNPFKSLAAELHADTGRIVARPASGPGAGDGRRYPVPLRFHHVVAVCAAGGEYRVLALVPIGSRPSDVAGYVRDGVSRMSRELTTLDGGPAPQSSETERDDPGGAPVAAPSNGPPASRPSETSQRAPRDPGPGAAPPDSGRRPPPPPPRR
jgi:hypothetical protein